MATVYYAKRLAKNENDWPTNLELVVPSSAWFHSVIWC